MVKDLVNSFIFNVILLPVGMHKERMLNFILRNENIDISVYRNILEKLFNSELVSNEQINLLVDQNAPKLYKTFAANENNLFEKAIFEHNLISLSKIYENISFKTLSGFLKFSEEKVL